MLRMVSRIKRYLKVWWVLTLGATQIAFISRFGALLFLLGKIIRFLFFFLFLFIIATRTRLLGGYTLAQMLLFYFTFNFIDSLTQFFLREVYRFRQHIVSGYFDHYLTKPLPVLLRSLFGGSDALDIPMLFIFIIALFITAQHVGHATALSTVLYIVLLGNSFLIALSFHIFVLSLGILTTEVDNAIMVYRDLTQMGRIPIDIYQEPLRSILTFIIPVGMMMTVPAKVFMQITSVSILMSAFAVSLILFFLSIQTWHFALRSYTSASS